MGKVRGTGKVIEFNALPQVAVLQRFLFPVLLLGMLLPAGCVTTQEASENRSALGQIQVQVSNLERDMIQIKEQTTGLSAIKENQSNLLTQTSDLSKDLQVLRGRFDENKYSQDKTLKDIMSELELQKARISALENQLKDISREKPADIKEGVRKSPESNDKAPAAKSKKSLESAAKLYDEAHIALKQKKFGEARRKFERFIKEHPKESLTPNAYFWIGEIYYAEKKYEDAILAYEDFLKKYPNHDKAKSAMLKQGYSFLNLSGKNNKLAGRDILETLTEKYPKSKEAELAKKKLKETSKSASSTKSKKKN
jgi:tol-pal system protein YbgF